MSINHILFPTDGSENSKKALAYVKALALNFEAKVTVMHAYPSSVTEWVGLHDRPIITKARKQRDDILKEYGRQLLKETEEELSKTGIRTDVQLVPKDARYAIVDTLKENHYDLVVMGTRGLGTVKSFLMGSVSYYVIHHTQCPVLCIPAEQ